MGLSLIPYSQHTRLSNSTWSHISMDLFCFLLFALVIYDIENMDPWNIEDLYNSLKRIEMWLQSRCFAMFIPCHWEQNKVQATVWCRSSLLSICPPMPRCTPAPVWSTTPLAHITHLQPSRKKTYMDQLVFLSYLHLILSEESIQDEVSPEHRPLTFNILKQLELCWVVVQPRWVLVRPKPETAPSMRKQ